MRSILALISISAVVLVLALLYVFSPKDNKDMSSFDVDYPHTISQRVSLRADGDGSKEVYRLSSYNDAGVKVMDTIDYENGVQSKVFYRPDGTVDRITDYYPEEAGQSRKVKSRIQMMDDGIRYSWHKAYRMGGSIARSGQRLPNGSYTTIYYRGDKAGSIERQVSFSADQELAYEIVYAESGVPKTRTERNASNQLVTTYFRENGTRAYSLVDPGGPQMKGSFFSEDGTKEVGDFQMYSYAIMVSVMPEDNPEISKLQVRYTETTREFTAFGANGKARYMQKWELVDGKSFCDENGTWKLVEITEFHGDHFEGLYNWSDNTEVEMHKDGTTPRHIVVKKDASKSLEVYLYEDGSAKRIVEFDSRGRQTGSNEYEPGKMKNPVPISGELSALTKVGCLPVGIIKK